MTFKNKVIWITGASSGIGKGLALELSKLDCKLILSSRNKEQLQKVQESCKNPENIKLLPFDLAHYANMVQVTDDALKLFERIDILINNGGISQRSPIIETSIDVDKKLMEIDYLGTVALSKALLPHFVANQSGQYVVVSSLMGKFSSPLRSAYCGAKHALHGFFDALRLEHDKDNIKVTMICPGFVNTDVARNALTADGSKQGYQDDMTENGLQVDIFVKRMLNAIRKEKYEAYIGKFEKFGVFVKRLSPRLLHKLILRSKVK
ncbi:SDR family oxidoreductase [Xanthomarina spongicola]|uniref:Short-subunit dehydrogenase n=1 Tax=Xanthomarina spongicola TaxID=570520 RepID=A0A316DRF0_9FLAO|nr:SDR family oxidoreductase [Xanthomarina spongicola]PWK19739.1 short-subunit dehydrogenase [Xanthomarina spongicola]